MSQEEVSESPLLIFLMVSMIISELGIIFRRSLSGVLRSQQLEQHESVTLCESWVIVKWHWQFERLKEKVHHFSKQIVLHSYSQSILPHVIIHVSPSVRRRDCPRI
jgi:hypothetical protein